MFSKARIQLQVEENYDLISETMKHYKKEPDELTVLLSRVNEACRQRGGCAKSGANLL